MQPDFPSADVKVLEPYVMCQQKYFWLQPLVKRGVLMVGACTSAENRADLGTKLLPVHRLRQLRQWNGMVLDPDENSVTGDKEDG